jgi:hypothetical protein
MNIAMVSWKKSSIPIMDHMEREMGKLFAVGTREREREKSKGCKRKKHYSSSMKNVHVTTY